MTARRSLCGGGRGPPSGPDVVGAIERPATLEKRERALMKIACGCKGREPAPAVSHGFKTLMEPSSFQARAQGRISLGSFAHGIGGVPGACEGGWRLFIDPLSLQPPTERAAGSLASRSLARRGRWRHVHEARRGCPVGKNCPMKRRRG